MNSWFISWCTYTSSEAGGMAVDRFGSLIEMYPVNAEPDQIHQDILLRLKRAQNTDYLSIVAFNRV